MGQLKTTIVREPSSRGPAFEILEWEVDVSAREAITHVRIAPDNAKTVSPSDAVYVVKWGLEFLDDEPDVNIGGGWTPGGFEVVDDPSNRDIPLNVWDAVGEIVAVETHESRSDSDDGDGWYDDV